MQNPCISNSNLERLTVMKKIHIAFAVLATAVLSSCVQEKSFNGVTVGENEIAFVLQGAATRSAEVSPVTKGISYDLGKFGDRNLFLEETITDLNYAMAETRGVPVYTENVGSLDLYKKGLVVSFPDVADATFETMDDAQIKNSGWRFTHTYAKSPWPANQPKEKVHVYFRMPASMTSNGVTVSSQTGGKTTFSYTSPTTAEAQQDIIFSHAYLSKDDHEKALPNGYGVNFYHALTAVKFAIKNLATERADMKIKVTGISFIGLKNTGTCVVDAGAEELTDKITWNASKTAADNTMTQAFAYADGDSNDKYVVNLSDSDNPSNLPASFYAGGTSQNLNKSDASYTFWVIPQAFAENDGATLRINYDMNGVSEYMDVPLYLIASQAWNAGELRTFTFKLNDVNLKIEDKVELKNATDTDNPYKESVKSDVTITNTGNTDSFIRASIVGQWLDAETGDIIFGFRDEINELYLVESWYEDQFVNDTYSAETSHGKFEGLPGYKKAANFKPDEDDETYGWVLCEDGYYYYTKPVAPNGTTSALFDSYTLKNVPKPINPFTLDDMDPDTIYFTLEIASQAISANKLDGTHYNWDDAWANALGAENKPVQK